MSFEKPEMEVVLFEADEIVTASLCTNDCQTLGCTDVCTGNTCTNAIICTDHGCFWLTAQQ